MTADLQATLQQALGNTYAIERELGGGGMSRVFVAEDTALGRKVVVKVLPPETAAGVSIGRFKREIQLAARLQHPHIVPLLSAGDADGLPYFTMPLVQGESLRARLARHGEFPVVEAMRILREIAAALGYAHEHGVVHRDIKPDNVLLSGGSAMVTDFGVAKALSASSNAEHGGVTSLGVALGTPAYMAPEQASADPGIDHRADIYAFGVLAYELLTGQAPFTGRTPANLLAAHVTEAPEAITKRRGSLPPALGALVMRCLEKRPADRPQSAAEILHELDEITTPSGGMQPTAAMSPTPAEPVVQSLAPTPRMQFLSPVWIATALILLVITAVGWYVVARASSSPAVPTSDARSIAVLPFTSGGDTGTAYFSEGVSDEVRSRLTGVEGLTVKARSSSYAFQGKKEDVRTIGTTLGVAAVLEGDVRRTGSRIRVTADLVNVTDGSALWSRTLEGDATNVFALQDSVALAIASALQTRLTERQRGTKASGTSNAAAYDLFLRGRFLEEKRGLMSIRQAIASYQQAIALDPRFARAYAGIASALLLLPWWSDTPIDSVLEPATRAVDRALALDSTLAEAYAGKAQTYWARFRWADGEQALRRAVALNPNYVMARHWLTETLIMEGRPAEAVESGRAAVTLDSLQPIAWMSYGVALAEVGNDTAAVLAYRRVLDLDPSIFYGHQAIAQLHLVRARPLLALRELERADADTSLRAQALLGYAYARAGQRSKAEAILHRIAAHPDQPGAAAYVTLGLGDVDGAMQGFLAAASAYDPFIANYILEGTGFGELRSHAKFPELIRRLNLQDLPVARAAPPGWQ